MSYPGPGPGHRRVVALGLAIGLLLSPARLAAQLVVWSGTGDWTNTANWSLVLIPGLSHTAVVGSGTLTVSDTRSVGALQLSGGSLTGAGSLTLVNAGSTWTGGNLNGAGSLIIGSNATLTISGAAVDHDYSQRTITNNGSVSWTGGRLRSGQGGAIVNNGVWNDTASSTFNNDYSGTTATFTNSLGATYNKTASGTTTFSIPFNNSGTVTVGQGTLLLQGGGTSSATGNFSASANTTVQFGANYTVSNAATLGGTGLYSLTGGTLTLSGTFSAPNFSITGGTLEGTQAFSGSNIIWSAGTLNVAAAQTTTLASGSVLTISTTADHDYARRSIVNNGTVHWTGGRLRSGQGGSIVNNGLWNDTASSTFNNDYSGTVAIFSNAPGATYNKTATGTTTFSIPFHNSGNVIVGNGTLALSGGGASSTTGNFSASANTTVQFGANYTVDNAATLTGTGLYSLTSGTLTFSGTFSAPNFSITGGTLEGTHTFASGANIIWSAGTLNVAAAQTTTLAGGSVLTISTTADHDYARRAIVNNGTVHWTGGRLRSGQGGSIVNHGLWNDTASSTFNNDYSGPTATFTNAPGATYNKSASGTTTFSIPFSNSGNVIVTNGTLSLSGGGTIAAGSNVTADPGTLVRFGANYTVDNAASLTGGGLYEVTAGTVSLGGTFTGLFTLSGGTLAGTQTFGPGTLTWNTSGNMNGTGTTTIALGGNLSISGAGVRDFNQRTLVNQGTLAWQNGDLRSGNGGSITNASGGNVNDTASGSINMNAGYGGSMTFTNAAGGTYTKSGAGTTTFHIPVTNDGAMNINNGTLVFSGGGSMTSGNLTLASGANVHFTGGTFTQAGPANISGPAANYVVNGGTWSIGSGAMTLPNLSISGGTLTGAVSLSTTALTMTGGALLTELHLTGNSTWNSGQWNSSAPARVAAGTTLTIATTAVHDFNQRTITNEGTVNWTGGELRSGNGGSFVNASAATLNDTASSNLNAAYGGAASFSNAGSYVKAASGDTTMHVPFTNTGSLAVNAGNFVFNAGGSSAAGSSLTVASGSVLRFSGGTFNLDNATIISGASGVYEITGGTLALAAGTLTLPNLLVTAGSLTGAGLISTPSLAHSGGTLLGNFTVTGPSTWSGGNWNAAGTTATIAATATLNATNPSVLDFNARTILNQGIFNWQGGQLRSGTGGVFTNATGATFNDTASNSFNVAYGGSLTFTNQGTYNKNAAGVSSLGAVFNNHNAVNVNAGTLDFSGGGTNNAGATVNVASGSTLRFGGGTFTFATTAGLVDAGGNYQVNGGSVSFGAGALTLPNLSVGGGTFNTPPGGLTVASIALTSGEISGSGQIGPTTLTMSGGSFSAPFNLTGTTSWTGGNWNGAASTTIGAGGVVNASNPSVLDFNQRTIVNQGTFNWQGGQLRSGTSGSITNAAGGVFTDTASNSLNAAYGGPFSFTNAGTYNKNAAGTTSVGVAFTNQGSLNLNAGTLSLAAGGSNSAGATVNVAAGTTLRFDGGTFTFATTAGLVDGGGSYQVNGGTLAFTAGALALPNVSVGGGTFELPPGGLTVPAITMTNGAISGSGIVGSTVLTMSGGTFSAPFNLTGTSSWTGGNWNGANNTTIGAGGVVNASNPSVLDFNQRTIVNQGTFNWQGGQLRSGTSGSITNAAGAVFNDTASNSLNAAYGGPFSFTNAGTYNKNAAGTTSIGAAFSNQGSLNLNAGTLSLAAGGSNSAGATLNVAAGTTLRFDGGTFTFATTAGLVDSGGSYQVNGGTLAFTAGALALPNVSVGGGTFELPPGGLTVPAITMTNGAISGSGIVGSTALTMSGGTFSAPFNLTGTSSWTGGNWNGASNTTIGAGATLNASNPSVLDFNARTIVNQGSFNWQGGQLRSGTNGAITNASGAIFNDTASNSLNAAYGGPLTFSNDGTYNKNAAGTTSIGAVFNNQGVVNLNAGTLDFANGGTHAAGASFNAASGTTLRFSGGTFVIAGTSGLSGAGANFQFVGGTVTFSSGSLTLPNLALSGATLNLPPGGLTVPALAMSGGTLAAGPVAPTVLMMTGGTFAVPSAALIGTSTWDGGNWNGAGTIAIQAGATLNVGVSGIHDFNQRTIANHGTFHWQSGQLRTGTGGSIVNEATGTFTDAASNQINTAYGGASSFVNRGLYTKAVVGTTDLFVPFTNDNGTVTVTNGTLRFGSGFTQTAGTLFVGAGASLAFDGGLTLGGGLLFGGGSIAGNVSAQGQISPGTGLSGIMGITGNLSLLPLSSLLIELDGFIEPFTPGVHFDQLNVSGSATLGGTLQINVTSFFTETVSPTDTFLVLNSGSLSGAFANVPTTGLRLGTLDGFGSFQVNFGVGSQFGANAVVLSNWAPVPEPSTYALLALGAVVVFVTLRRRR